jgi:hypothetical protein
VLVVPGGGLLATGREYAAAVIGLALLALLTLAGLAWQAVRGPLEALPDPAPRRERSATTSVTAGCPAF